MPVEMKDEAEVRTDSVRFVDSQREVLEAVSFTGPSDPSVEVAASRYHKRGFLLYDGQSRSVHPILCLSVALEQENREIVVIPR